MGEYVRSENIGTAWRDAFTRIVDAGGDQVNLMVDIVNPLEEDLGVRDALQLRLADLKISGRSAFAQVQSMHTVANTIFPVGLYRPGAPDAAERFIANVVRSERLRERTRGSRWGTYAGRLVAYPGRNGAPVNQLERILEVLRKDLDYKDRYEVPLWEPANDLPLAATSSSATLHGDSVSDNRARGGPCLAHISFTSFGGALSMTAVYRRHEYEQRAYGNFLGLARLLHFLAKESGRAVGNLLVVASHASTESPAAPDFAATLAGLEPRPATIELTARPLGVGTSDLDLPEPRKL
ncbi:MAG: hypothetical protein K0Q46_1866 [Rhodococcus erythropolis]|jgi:hypothetical protein|nr:hypothetical protein [Rhodococcus erythropolis]MDF2895080.1 hypothetical protein [Rhodococcus erythropolis]